MGDFSARHEDDREAALLELARVLYDKMEHLSPEGKSWDETTDDEREFCRQCAFAVLRRSDAICKFYGWSAPRDHDVGGHSSVGKQSDFDD